MHFADAVREYERLLAQPGRRTDGPHFALPFLQLGELQESAGRGAVCGLLFLAGAVAVISH